MQIILTRPETQQSAWRTALLEQGWMVQSLPMIEIAALPFDLPQRSSRTQAIMFVSANAVSAFFSRVYERNWPMAVEKTASNAIDLIVSKNPKWRVWATGSGTMQRLLEEGVIRERIDAPDVASVQMDSESLWQIVAQQVKVGRRVLIVRGRDAGLVDAVGSYRIGRDWLEQRIQAAGAEVLRLCVYERRVPIWSELQMQQAQRWLQDGSVWLWSSSQAIQNLPQVLDVSSARCVCTHERIAQAARARGFAVVCTSRPVMADMVASIKSLA